MYQPTAHHARGPVASFRLPCVAASLQVRSIDGYRITHDQRMLGGNEDSVGIGYCVAAYGGPRHIFPQVDIPCWLVFYRRVVL